MSRKANIINYIITIALTMLALFFALSKSGEFYGSEMFVSMLRFAVGAIVAGLINAFMHELGHLISGKKNGFVFSSMVIWFFKWSKINNKMRFDLVMMGDEAGYTEMIPSSEKDIEKGLKRMTRGGIIMSFVAMIIGIPPLFMSFLPVWIFSIWVMFLPIGLYYFLGAVLPSSSYGILNDGAVLYHLRKGMDNSKVIVNLLKIQAQLYNGKTPSQVDENLYFDLPQLPEDNPNFALLLNARYAYYLDKKDYENAIKTTKRLLSLEEYLPKQYMLVFKTDALYNACTIDFNEDIADDLMYELDKYLNNINSATNIRAKLAYLINVRHETDLTELFITKGHKEADRCQIKGLGLYEKRLLDELVEEKAQEN